MELPTVSPKSALSPSRETLQRGPFGATSDNFYQSRGANNSIVGLSYVTGQKMKAMSDVDSRESSS